MAAFPSLCAPHEESRPAAQRSGGHQGVATRKATGDLATHGGAGDPTSEKEQCVGTCDRGLEEGAAHRRCGTSPLRSLIRAAAAEQGTPTAQPLGVTCLLPVVEETLGPDRISGSLFLARGTRDKSCRALCWWPILPENHCSWRFIADLGKFPEFALRPPGALHGDSGTRPTQGIASGPQPLLWDCSHG